MKKLSVNISVYNTNEELLEQCLRSCDGFDDIEVIVVDDGSNKDYSSILDKHDIKYLKTANYGVSHARNMGIDISEGEYITILDSDDTIILNNELINSLNTDIVLSRNYIVNDKAIPNKYLFEESRLVDKDLLRRDMFVLEDRSIECVEPVWAKFYKRDFLLGNNIRFNENLRRGEDVLFNYEAYSKANNIYYLNEFTYNYTANDNSVTRSFDKIMDTNTFKLLEEFESLFKRLNIEDPNYTNYVFRLMVRLMRKYYVHLSREEFDEKIDLLFSNSIINQYLDQIDINNYDIYKQKLHELIVLKDKINLYDYIEDVCSKKLLKK